MIETELIPSEVACTMEALHDMLRDRMFSIVRGGPYRKVPHEAMKNVVGSAMTAYMRLRNQMIEHGAYPEFLATFGFSEEVFDLETQMQIADDWEGVPDHSGHEVEGCSLCTQLGA